MKRLKKGLVLLALTSSISLFASQAAAPKADVFVVKDLHDVKVELKYPAVVKSAKKVDVIARALGVLKKKNFNEGDKVNKGDILYEIEDNSYKAELDSAKASLRLAEVTLKNNERKWNRIKKLFAQKATSLESKDNAQAAYEEALATVSMQKARLQQAQIRYDYTKVKAPISGYTGLKNVDVGSLVYANETKLITITQNDNVYVEFSVPLSDFNNFKSKKWATRKGDKIKLNLIIDKKELQKEGVVDFIDVNINRQTSVVKLRAVFKNMDNSLMAGKFTRVVLNNIYQNNTVEIPQKALLQDDNGTSVFVVNGDVVGVKTVEIERENGKNFIIKAGSLSSGDKVIVNNFFRVAPNQKVQIDNVVN